MDWATRKVLSWRLSNTLDTTFCVEALKDALFKAPRVICGTHEGNGTDMTPARAEELFREYGKVMKGKKQLGWSRGLKAMFGIDEKTDEEIAEEVDRETTLFASIPLPTWRIILAADKRAEVLAVCEKGEEAFFDYLIELTDAAGELEP